MDNITYFFQTKLLPIKTYCLIIPLTLCFLSCIGQQNEQSYSRWVGDISPDSELDNPDFELCGFDFFAMQYFHFDKGFQYEGEKTALLKEFKDKFTPINNKDNGYIRIRFIVNCKGKTGRHRVIQSDLNLKKKKHDDRVTSQILDITKNLTGWKICKTNGIARDYYQYLVFKIESGEIKSIMP